MLDMHITVAPGSFTGVPAIQGVIVMLNPEVPEWGSRVTPTCFWHMALFLGLFAQGAAPSGT